MEFHGDLLLNTGTFRKNPFSTISLLRSQLRMLEFIQEVALLEDILEVALLEGILEVALLEGIMVGMDREALVGLVAETYQLDLDMRFLEECQAALLPTWTLAPRLLINMEGE
mmetsp:Transcript_18627/g.39139  ORF Transcript_18627/g.39139 Transcript_18627/m.39139 type:complete len:113 (-) Transcript_18627:6207-6545(-)